MVDDAKTDPQTLEPPSGEDLCPRCLQALTILDDYCPQCGTPIASTAGLDQMKRIQTVGYLQREAASRPRSLIVVVGMWLLFGVPLVMLLVDSIVNHFSDNARGHIISAPDTGDRTFGILAEILAMTLFVAVYGALLWKTTRNYIMFKSQRHVGPARSDHHAKRRR